jgi:TonB family protein
MGVGSLSAAVRFAAVAVFFLAVVGNPAAQVPSSAMPPDAGVVLTKLSTPVYPPLARQAHITGDVVVQVSIGKDGSIESVELFDGHPMLAPAALDSAKQSTFACQGCEATTSYLLTYTFGISRDCPHFGPNCEPLEPHAPLVTQSEDKITLTVEPSCICDPVGKIIRIRVRAAKCLYLWKCGSRDGDDK